MVLGYSVANPLNNHIKLVHSSKEQEKSKEQDNFACDECQFATKERKTLTHHVKTVHGNGRNEFCCNKCKFQTNQLKTLNKHLEYVHKKVHFSCDSCEFRTIDEKELEKHIASQHYQCELCEFKTVFRKILQNHVSKDHPDHIPCKKSRFK